MVRGRGIGDALGEVCHVVLHHELVVSEGWWVSHAFAIAVDLVWVHDDLLGVLVQRLALLVDVLQVSVDF